MYTVTKQPRASAGGTGSGVSGALVGSGELLQAGYMGLEHGSGRIEEVEHLRVDRAVVDAGPLFRPVTSDRARSTPSC